jgi:hypothetical protein
MTAEDERSRKIQQTLDKSKKDQFLKAAENFPNTSQMTFGDYQILAFLTARTAGKQLLEVCLSVLWQLGAELMRRFLPEIELDLNRSVVDRKVNVILGEIAWHVAAVASLYHLSLDDVAVFNQRKLNFRQNRADPTPLHDEFYPAQEQLPRQFEVTFVSVGPGRTRMYMNGRQMGNELTDNAYDADGYRFHDVMHLANAAMLGWSPVLRSMLGRKRRSTPEVDEVEDGARARIVEELIIKAVHAEGERLARARHPEMDPEQLRLFENSADLTFRLLKTIRSFAAGLEVESNRYWEWEEAILRGFDLFYEIRRNGQGRVRVDLEQKSLEFSPCVHLDIPGTVCGMGADVIEASRANEAGLADSLRRATLAALGEPPSVSNLSLIDVDLSLESAPRVQVQGDLRCALWRSRVVALRAMVARGAAHVNCTVLALADPSARD